MCQQENTLIKRPLTAGGVAKCSRATAEMSQNLINIIFCIIFKEDSKKEIKRKVQKREE